METAASVTCGGGVRLADCLQTCRRGVRAFSVYHMAYGYLVLRPV